MALPFDLYNSSTIDRPLFVTGLWSREKGDWREERLGWETLDPGTRAPASVTAQEFDRPGLHEVEIMWTVATRWRSRQENFAFSSRVLLNVAGESAGSAGPVVQISSENAMNGNVIQITDNTSRGKDDGKVVSAIDMNIHRLDVEERRIGGRRPDGLEVIPDMEDELVGPCLEPLAGHERRIGAAVAVRGGAHDRAAGVAVEGEELDRHAHGGLAVDGIQHVGGQASHGNLGCEPANGA